MSSEFGQLARYHLDDAFSKALVDADILSVDAQVRALTRDPLPTDAKVQTRVVRTILETAAGLPERSQPLIVRLLRRGCLAVDVLESLTKQLGYRLAICGFPRCEAPFNFVPKGEPTTTCRSCGYTVTRNDSRRAPVVAGHDTEVDAGLMPGISGRSRIVTDDTDQGDAAPTKREATGRTVARRARRHPTTRHETTERDLQSLHRDISNDAAAKAAQSGAEAEAEVADAAGSPVGAPAMGLAAADSADATPPLEHRGDQRVEFERARAMVTAASADTNTQPPGRASSVTVPTPAPAATQPAAQRTDSPARNADDKANRPSDVAVLPTDAKPPSHHTTIAAHAEPPPPSSPFIPSAPPPPDASSSALVSAAEPSTANKPRKGTKPIPQNMLETPAVPVERPRDMAGPVRVQSANYATTQHDVRDARARDTDELRDTRRTGESDEQPGDPEAQPPLPSPSSARLASTVPSSRRVSVADLGGDLDAARGESSVDADETIEQVPEPRRERKSQSLLSLPMRDPDAASRSTQPLPWVGQAGADEPVTESIPVRQKSRRWRPSQESGRLPVVHAPGDEPAGARKGVTSTTIRRDSQDGDRPAGSHSSTSGSGDAVDSRDSHDSRDGVLPSEETTGFGLPTADLAGKTSGKRIVGHSDRADPQAPTIRRLDTGDVITDTESADGVILAGSLGAPSVVQGFRVRWALPDENLDLRPTNATRRLKLLRDHDFSGADPSQRYEVGPMLARGGMGMIMIAQDRDIRRHVAVKILPGTKDDPESRAIRGRFLAEAQVTGQLEHPNIVPVHDIGVDQKGRPYYTMKLLRATSLGEILEDVRLRRHAAPARYSQQRLLQIFLKLCDGLAYAHSRGVIHRDLKPDNIMVGEFGEVTIIDWGLAKIIGEPDKHGDNLVTSDRFESGIDVTGHGSIAGTPAYMSPEQAAGRVSDLDVRSDIYSLGAVLYEILTFVRAFDGREVDRVLARVIGGEFPLPSERTSRAIPRELEIVVLKAMAKEPLQRYASVDELRQEIEHYMEGRTLVSVSYSPFQRGAKWLKRNKLAAAAAVLLVMAVLATIVVSRVVQDNERLDRIQQLMAEGEELRNAGDYDAALSRYLNVLELDRRNADADRYARETLALSQADTTREENLAHAEQRFEEGQLLYEEGNYDLAYEAFWEVYTFDRDRPGLRTLIDRCEEWIQAAETAEAIAHAKMEARDWEEDARDRNKILAEQIRQASELEGDNATHTQQLRRIRDMQLATEQRAITELLEEAIHWLQEVLHYDADDRNTLKRVGDLWFQLYLWALNWNDTLLATRAVKELKRAVPPEVFEERYKELVNTIGTVVLRGANDPTAELALYRFALARDGRTVPVPYSVAGNKMLADPMSAVYRLRNPLETWQSTHTIYPLDIVDDHEGQTNLVGVAPYAQVQLSAGSYLLVASAAQRATVRMPFVIRRAQTTDLPTLRLPKRDGLPARFVLIPEGHFEFGGDPAADSAGPLEQLDIARPFAIARGEVTARDYFLFLNDRLRDIPATPPGDRRMALDALRASFPQRQSDAGRWTLLDSGDDLRIDPGPDDLSAPVCGINFTDAQAYVAWRAERDGVPYRLPSEIEWEWAARGADARAYPWGSAMNAEWALTADSGGSLLSAEPMGVYKTRYLEDESVFGVLDVAGSVREWTSSRFYDGNGNGTTDHGVARGGSFLDGANGCRLATRHAQHRRFPHPATGLRLALDLDPSIFD